VTEMSKYHVGERFSGLAYSYNGIPNNAIRIGRDSLANEGVPIHAHPPSSQWLKS
jgi:hypothetical protein